MSIRIDFAGASLLKPGAYSDTQVAQSQIASPALGVVALIGESDEGTPFASESGLNVVTFGPDEFQAIADKFGSGELVDAARLAISPSNDPAIRGGAQELILLKTNASSVASLAIPSGASSYGTLSAKKAGLPGNSVSYACSVISGKAIITLNRLDKGVTEVSSPLGGTVALTIQCTDAVATAATLTIDALNVSTIVTGGSAAGLSTPLASFNTIGQLAAFISAQPGYSASAPVSQANKPVAQLDRVSAQSIKTALGVKRDAQDVKDFFAKSSMIKFVPTATAGLPTASPRTYLVGGAKGGTSQAAIQGAIDALLKLRVNFIVPLFSRSAAADQADNLTDASSNYDIDATHLAINSHVNQASTVKGRKERQAWVGYKGTFSDAADKASTLNSARVAMCFQDCLALSASTGLVVQKQPHMLGVIAAGMHAAAPVGTPITFKAPLINGAFQAAGDFDAELDADKGIESNLTFIEKNPSGGFRFVLDNSTYAQDLNAWIFNRPAVLYAADVAAFAIRENTSTFVGRRNADVSAETIKNVLIGVMDSLKSAGIIVGDTNTGGKGYKDMSVKINGSIVNIDVTLALVEGLEFILSSIKVQRVSG